jgi:membrane fusion protein, type I secretion system
MTGLVPFQPKAVVTWLRKAAVAVIEPGRDEEGIHSLLRIGSIAVFLLVGGLGIWAVSASLAGAVIAQGTVVVESSVKKVQHQAGGIVSEIRVRDGDHVNAGDILVRLDATVAGANLGVITAQLDELQMREARLKAERDGIEVLELPATLQARAESDDVREVLAGERTLFESRRAALAGQKAQLNERINQLDEQIIGIEGQARAKAREIDLVKKELKEIETLWEKKLTTLARVTASRRDAARIDGERSQLIAASALVKDKIVETRLQIIQLDQDFKLDIAKDLREVQTKAAAFIEQRAAAQDQLQRVEIRSPQNGIVHQLAVHTVGGVVNPSEPIMLIVPDKDALVVDAKIAPQDIDQVFEGQSAFVRFTAFNQRTTPECNGTVVRIAADLARDPVTGQSFFAARVALPPSEVSRLRQLKLLPGMPAEIFIRTSERTALSYFLRPLSDQLRRAFTEE